MGVGDFTAFTTLLAQLVWPTLTLGFMLALVQRGRASWARLVELAGDEDRPAGGHRAAARRVEPSRRTSR